jgi:hypothetical protein
MSMTARLLLAAAIPIVLAGRTSVPAGPALFSADTPLAFEIKAPFTDLIAAGRETEDYSVEGTVSYRGDGEQRTASHNVKVALRGHTSRRESECAFPKLKLQFSRTPGGPFAGTRSVKIGTHCGDSTADTLTPRFGRLPNERSPYREAFVYRLLDLLQVPTLKARPARIAYLYTDAPEQAPFVRNAMLLEDDDDARQRLGADQEIEPAAFSNAREAFKVEDTAEIAFVEALIGNFDWCLRMTAEDTYRCDARRILWNVMALRAAGRTFPLIYDFDVSGMVAGHHLWFGQVYNEAFLPSKSHPEIEVLGQLQRTRALFSREVLDATRKRFIERKADAYALLKQAPLDEPGRQRIQEYIDAFYKNIESDDAFYRPVVTAPNTLPYATAERSAAVCNDRGAIPIATAISEPIATRGSMIQVVLLDTQWHWATPVKCPEIHQGAVWIESSAVSSDFPTRRP